MHSDLNSNTLFDLHHSTSPSNKIYLRSTILETITTKLQIPYSLTRVISIFDPPPTIEHIRFERRNAVACKPRDSFNQPARVKNRLAISYRSDFTCAVNREPYGGITLNENRSGLVSLREDYVFYGYEKSNVLLLRYYCGSSEIVVKRVSIDAIKATRAFQWSEERRHGVPGASGRKQPCLYRQLTSCRTLDRVGERPELVQPLVRGELTIMRVATIYEISRKSPRRQWRFAWGATPFSWAIKFADAWARFNERRL